MQPTRADPASRPSALRRAVLASLALALGLVGSAVIFGTPEFLAAAIAQATGSVGLLPEPNLEPERVQSSQWPQDWSALPPSVRAAISETGKVARLRALRQRPPVIIESATLAARNPGAPLVLATPRLVLRDATIVTDGADLTLEVEELEVRNSVVRSFPNGAKAAGGPGRGAGTLRLVVHDGVRGVLRVDLSGEAGLPGNPGALGAAGAAGEKGPRARSERNECQTPAGPGVRGGPGGRGGKGGDGTKGGDGGALEIIAADPAAVAAHIDFEAHGGAGGPAGPGGAGGPGGPGGLGGDPAGVCFGDGPAGAPGAPGPTGETGKAGQDGREGAMRLERAG